MHSVLRRTRKAWPALCTAALLVLPLSAEAQQQNQQDAARELSGRLSKLEQDIRNLQRQVPGSRTAQAAAGTEIAQTQAEETDLTVRVMTLERVIEQLTGQIEEYRFATDRMSRQLKVLTDDMGLRLATIEQSLGLTGAGASLPPSSPPASPGAPLVPPPAASTTPPIANAAPVASRPNDEFSQPVSSQPSSRPAAAPVQATQAPAGAADEGLNPGGGFVIRTDAQGRPLPPDPKQQQAAVATPPPPPQQEVPRAAPNPGAVASNQVASLPSPEVTLPEGTPKQQYEFAFGMLTRQDYPKAESALREFLKRHPKDPLAGNAQYWLGETYYVRGDFQQAAVEFMAGYQKYPKTNKGPDNLLKLGMAMAKLNQTQGACTALGRISKDYPDAPAQVVKSSQTERAKLKCK